MQTPIYLDYAAATPMDPEVLAAMTPYFTERFYNPSAAYLTAVDVRKDLEAARARVAQILGTRSSEIIFTAGGTEANNLAIKGVLEQYPNGRVAVSAIEHESVLRSAQAFGGDRCREISVTAQGIVVPDAVTSKVDDDTVLVSVMYANNEIGTVQPIRQIALALHEIRAVRRKNGNQTPLYFHVDAAQAGAYLDLHVARLGVDLLTLNAGKMYGPKQCGVLFAASHVRFAPQILGGGQERGQRSGTENVAGAIGLAKALDLVQMRRHQEVQRLKKLQDLFFDLLEKHIPSVVINGSRKTRLPNNVHITIPGTDNERILISLDNAGILCAAGSACSASNEAPSHVLKAMGISEKDAQSSLRFSMGRQTNEQAVRYVITILASLL